MNILYFWYSTSLWQLNHFFFLLYFVLLSSPVNLSLWWYVCAAMFDLILMSVGQCYTNFEWWEYWVHMGWSVRMGVRVCVSRVLYKELFLRLECRIVMEYWEDGLHVSPGLYETPCYSHTFLTVTNLYSPTGQGRSFHNYISVCCYS